MATYIIAGLLAVLVILAVRSYFGKKYRGGVQRLLLLSAC